MRPTSYRSSVPNPWLQEAMADAGTGSAEEVRFHVLGFGSPLVGVPTFPGPSVAPFHVPKMAIGS